MGLSDSMLPSEKCRQTILDGLKTKIITSGTERGDFFVRVKGEHLADTVDFCRSNPDCSFDSFVDLCGVDYFPSSPRFEVVVHLYSQQKNHRVRIRAHVPDDSGTVPSLVRFWAGADWQEREAYDMYGIHFEGHPNLMRILSPPDEKHFPQRKDFPLRGEREKGDE